MRSYCSSNKLETVENAGPTQRIVGAKLLHMQQPAINATNARTEALEHSSNNLIFMAISIRFQMYQSTVNKEMDPPEIDTTDVKALGT